jgi:hypothetical protein
MNCSICNDPIEEKGDKSLGPECSECHMSDACRSCMRNAHLEFKGEKHRRPLCFSCIDRFSNEKAFLLSSDSKAPTTPLLMSVSQPPTLVHQHPVFVHPPPSSCLICNCHFVNEVGHVKSLGPTCCECKKTEFCRSCIKKVVVDDQQHEARTTCLVCIGYMREVKKNIEVSNLDSKKCLICNSFCRIICELCHEEIDCMDKTNHNNQCDICEVQLCGSRIPGNHIAWFSQKLGKRMTMCADCMFLGALYVHNQMNNLIK